MSPLRCVVPAHASHHPRIDPSGVYALGRKAWVAFRSLGVTGDHQQHAAEIKPVPLTPPESMTPVRERDADQLGVALRGNNQLFALVVLPRGRNASCIHSALRMSRMSRLVQTSDAE